MVKEPDPDLETLSKELLNGLNYGLDALEPDYAANHLKGSFFNILEGLTILVFNRIRS